MRPQKTDGQKKRLVLERPQQANRFVGGLPVCVGIVGDVGGFKGRTLGKPPRVRQVPLLRFRPMKLGGVAVRVRTTLPVLWTLPS